MIRVWQRSIALVAGMAAVMPSVAAACPTCSDVIKADPVAAALSATTLLMIGMPFSLVGGIGGWVMFVYWRASRAAGIAAEDSAGGSARYPEWQEKENES